MANPKSRSDISDSKAAMMVQAGFSEETRADRIRKLLSGRDFKWLSQKTGIATSTLSDFSAGKGSRTENAVLIADALETSVEYLIRGGRDESRAQLISVDDAEWVHLPRFDLGRFTPEHRGMSLGTVPIQRPWLSSLDSNPAMLWLTTMPMTVAGLANEGDTIICKDAESDLVEGRTYIFMRDSSLLIRRVVIDRQGFSLVSTDTMVPPIELGRRDPPAADEQIVPVARILALLAIRLI